MTSPSSLQAPLSPPLSTKSCFVTSLSLVVLGPLLASAAICQKWGCYTKLGEDPNLKWFLCSKEGKNPEPAADKSKDATSDVSEITTDENVIVKQTRNRGSSRCGCLAKIQIKKFKGNLYRVYTFIERHNHPLVAKKDMIYMKSSRDLGYMKQHFLFQASNANFGPFTSFRLLKQMCGGFDRVGATVVDCDDDKLVGLFWADEQAIRDYAVFGDIVSFDATFRSNKYKMVFVPFTSINHHNRCITFASGLLSDETVCAYKWLLEKFKNAFGKDPNVVITDQDPSMKIAIPECFPNTRHRLCMWHIMQKLVTKVGTAICNKTNFKRRICDIVWTYQILPYEFEREWEIMIKDFQLDDNKWLQDMFDIRESWIPAFLRDELMAGLMRTTSRSKSENHFFDEIYASYSHCMSVNVVQVDNVEKYFIRDMQAENRIKGDNNFVVYQFAKNYMVINAPCFCNEALATLGQTTTGKESSNPFMADANIVDKECQAPVMISDAEEYLISEDPVKQGRMERYIFEEVYRKIMLEANTTRTDGSSRFHGDIQALLRRLDRQDLRQLYSLVQERFKDHSLEDGTSIQINMLVEKKYPLKKEILEKMINLKIEAEEESTMAHELIKFIKSEITEQNLKVNHKFRGGLLGIKELLQDNAAEGLNIASNS
ncbi:FAR1-related sequence 5-like protein [Tanacetum coccineum]|uniref:FAR1-related sequence 5-like protein n=1 Tax=Tanacetum coccineum TaxID=301880 RepID=A0ABQ4ZHP1_9ASTR